MCMGGQVYRHLILLSVISVHGVKLLVCMQLFCDVVNGVQNTTLLGGRTPPAAHSYPVVHVCMYMHETVYSVGWALYVALTKQQLIQFIVYMVVIT